MDRWQLLGLTLGALCVGAIYTFVIWFILAFATWDFNIIAHAQDYTTTTFFRVTYMICTAFAWWCGYRVHKKGLVK